MKDFYKKLPTMYKAVAAFCSLLVPFLTALATALQDGIVTANEWTTIIMAAAALAGGTTAVYHAKNEPAS